MGVFEFNDGDLGIGVSLSISICLFSFLFVLFIAGLEYKILLSFCLVVFKVLILNCKFMFGGEELFLSRLLDRDVCVKLRFIGLYLLLFILGKFIFVGKFGLICLKRGDGVYGILLMCWYILIFNEFFKCFGFICFLWNFGVFIFILKFLDVIILRLLNMRFFWGIIRGLKFFFFMFFCLFFDDFDDIEFVYFIVIILDLFI